MSLRCNECIKRLSLPGTLEGGPRPQYLLVTADDGGENKNFP